MVSYSNSESIERYSIEEIVNLIISSSNSKKLDFTEWLSIKDAAKYAGVSYNTFIKFRLRGLKVCEVEGIKRVSRKEIDRFLEEHSF